MLWSLFWSYAGFYEVHIIFESVVGVTMKEEFGACALSFFCIQVEVRAWWLSVAVDVELGLEAYFMAACSFEVSGGRPWGLLRWGLGLEFGVATADGVTSCLFFFVFLQFCCWEAVYLDRLLCTRDSVFALEIWVRGDFFYIFSYIVYGPERVVRVSGILKGWRWVLVVCGVSCVCWRNCWGRLTEPWSAGAGFVWGWWGIYVFIASWLER